MRLELDAPRFEILECVVFHDVLAIDAHDEAGPS